MKICIWCKKDDQSTSFNSIAHTIPQSLGGKSICTNVCDNCNSYFGSYQNQQLPIETVIKETFNISRFRYLSSLDQIGKNKALARYKSNLFQIDFKKNLIKPKGRYQIQSGFQKSLARLLKRGLYKMFLEEQERQFSAGHLEKFNFMRDFARNDIGDYPVFYFLRKYPMIVMAPEWAKYPTLILKEDQQMKYLINDDNFFEFEFLGHVFSIPVNKDWENMFGKYVLQTKKLKEKLFNQMIIVENFYDIDFTLRILND